MFWQDRQHGQSSGRRKKYKRKFVSLQSCHNGYVEPPSDSHTVQRRGDYQSFERYAACTSFLQLPELNRNCFHLLRFYRFVGSRLLFDFIGLRQFIEKRLWWNVVNVRIRGYGQAYQKNTTIE